MTTSQTISITGMTCASCVAKIQKHLGEHPDIDSVAVTLQPPQAKAQTRRTISDVELNTWLEPLGHYRAATSASPQPSPATPSLPAKSAVTYRPLIILLIYLLAVTGGVLFATGEWNSSLAMRLFMGGFFVAFSFFKMLDVRGFADAYRTYDLIANKWPRYGLVYPFIEFGLGISYLANLSPLVVNGITFVVMAVSLAGVLRAVLSAARVSARFFSFRCPP